MAGVTNVTVMFTDLVGSTALASRVGPEQAEDLRREHFGLLRSRVAEHGGREVKNLGDGLMVAFHAPSAAVAAAVEMQQRLELRNRVASPREPLLVRIGVSVGEADVDDDGDLFGTPVVQAARLCDVAEGGQVLAAALVPALVGTRGGFEFSPLGGRELKGLDGPLDVVEVGWETLPDDAADAPVVPVPERLSRRTPVFTGREREIAALRSAWDVASAGALGVVVVSGEAGIGKTTLVGELAHGVSGEGAIVVHGGCEEDLGVPFRPWIELLDHLVAHLPDEIVSAHLDEHGPQLAVLLPEIARRTSSPYRPVGDLEAERFRVFGAAVDLLGRTAAIAPLLVVLEDVHWADHPSLQLLRHLVTVGGERTLVAVTARSTDVAADGPVPDTLVALHRTGAAVATVDLAGLDAEELLALMEAAAGHPLEADGEQLREALAAETGGNPFFAVEILRHLAESGVIDRGPDDRWIATTDLGEHGLPVNVRQVVERRVARLGPDAERVLRAAAVIGREADLGLVATVLDVSDDVVVDVVDAAVEASLVVADGPERFRFVHALVGRILYESSTPPRRARIHRRIAAVLEKQPGVSAADRARHLAAGGSPDDVDRLIECAMEAGDEAIGSLAPAEAVRWYRSALEAIEQHRGGDGPARRERCHVMIRLGDAERQAGDAAHRERLLAATELAGELDDAELLVAAVLANHRGFSSTAGQVDVERIAGLERAIAAVGTGDSPARARLLATLCSELAFDDCERAASAADEATAVADRCADAATYADVIALTTFAHSVPWRLDERDHDTARAHELVQDLDDPMRRWRAALERRTVHLMRGDRDGANRALDELRAVVERLPMPYLRNVTGLAETTEAILDGDLGRAEELAGETFEYAVESGQPDAALVYGGQLFTIRYHEGRASELVADFARIVDETPGVSIGTINLASAHLQAGQSDRARALAGDLVAASTAIERDFMWPEGLAVCCDVALALGDLAGAMRSHEQLLPYADQSVFNLMGPIGAVAHRLGCLDALLGRPAQAVHFLEDALERHRRFRAPIYVAMSAVELSRLLAETEPARAAALADEAEQIRADHGLAGFYGVTGRWPLVS